MNDGTEFEGFRPKHDDILQLLEYVKHASSDKINLEENDLHEFINIDNDAQVTNSLTDGEILNNVLAPQDSESEEDCP